MGHRMGPPQQTRLLGAQSGWLWAGHVEGLSSHIWEAARLYRDHGELDCILGVGDVRRGERSTRSVIQDGMARAGWRVRMCGCAHVR